jgi:hypothetical protein
MSNETMATMLVTQLNNPDCSYLTGMTIGSVLSIKYILMAMFLMIIYKMVSVGMDTGIDYLRKRYFNNGTKGKKTRSKD